MNTYKLNAGAGSTFESVAEKAKSIATEIATTVEYDFNGVRCLVDKDTNLERLWRDYSNSWTMEWKEVGPNCVEAYAPDVQADFERRTKIREEKRAKEEAEYRAKETKERITFSKNVRGVALELSDPAGWEKARKANSDGYGKAALDYAEGWAKLMQVQIAKGKTVAECYESTQRGLGFLGITGFQFGCAVSILSQTWKHGEELKRVHNRKYGRPDVTEGTVNPAILTVSAK